MAGPPIFCDPDPAAAETLRSDGGGIGVIFTSLAELRDHLMAAFEEDTIVLGVGVSNAEAFAIADYMRVNRPSLGVILVRHEVTLPLMQEALRAGVREVVDRRDHLLLESAVKHSAHLAATLREQTSAQSGPLSTVSGEDGGGRGQVVVAFSSKGGCGKTMLVTNLATALANKGRRRVVILDLDLAFGDVAITMQLMPLHTIADAVPLNGQIDSTAVAAMLTTHANGVHAIVAPTEPSTAESIPATLISHLIDVLRSEFDFVVIDTPPNFDDQVLAALDSADLIALITTPDVPALKNLKVTVETLMELGYSRDKFRLVLNRSDAKVGISHAEVEKAAQLPITARIPSSREVPSTINAGEPIVQAKPNHAVSIAIHRFADQYIVNLASRQNDPLTNAPPRRGLMKKRRTRP
jgi:pilus assembly protein CpaE